MKYIKTFESITELVSIKILCRKFDIINYTINDDMSIDVNDHVDLAFESFDHIPLKFNNVYGDFNISFNKITNLINSPIYVSGHYIANNNKLTSLEGSPKGVDGNFSIYNNDDLKSLKGCPKRVGGDFCANECSLKTIKYISNHIGGDIYLGNNELKSTKYIPGDFNAHIDLLGNHKIPYVIQQNNQYRNYIIKYQNDYNIWNDDESLNMDRFNIMMNDMDK